MRWLFLAASMLIAVSASAQQTRRPEVLVLLNTSLNDDPAQAHRIMGYLGGVLKAHGVDYTVYGSPHNKPLRLYTMAPLGSVSAADLKTYWGRERAFDGLVIVNWDWPFPNSGTNNAGFADARFDSMSRVGKYPLIPALLVNARNGFYPSSSVCSLGTSAGHVTTNLNFPKQLGGPSFAYGSSSNRGNLVAAYSDGSIQKLIVCPSVTDVATATDTTIVWRRNAGAGITLCGTSSSSGNENLMVGIVPVTVAVTRWLQDFPDSLRPHPDFRFATHIDDGFKRGAEVNTQHAATISASMDTMVNRDVKYTVGVECTRDTLDLVDDNGRTVFENDMMTFYRPGYSKFTPHTHAGNSSSDQNMNASAANLKFFDIFGADRNRDCDPVSASDSSSYALMSGALRYMEQRFGIGNIDYTTMPATDDWVPPNVYESPITCSFRNLYASARRAGFTHIREAYANLAYSRSEPFGEGGLNWGPRTIQTDYGSLVVTGRAWNGYFPDAGEDAAQPASSMNLYLPRILQTMWVGSSGYDSNKDIPGQAPTNMIVQHVRNYTDAAPGLDVIRTVDNFFTILNGYWGYRAYRWVWSDELPAPGTQASVGAHAH